MEEDIPLKLIELSDFLRSPSILSKNLQFKQTKFDEQLNEIKYDDTQQSAIVLLKQKAICSDNQKNELILPKDVIVFADDMDRKKIGLFNKSTNHFSRHLLITSGAALQSLIPSLINAKEWIIVCKLKYIKRYTKQTPIHGNVVMSLNINHPLVRYEILQAFDLLQQTFNEVKSAYIVIDFCGLLKRWFKNYLQRTDQYPSLTNRLLYRYEVQINKCSITLGKRNSFQDNNHFPIRNSFQKIIKKSDDIPMQIYIDFNSLPTNVYSIQLDNIFIYSMNDQYRQILKDIGNGLSLVSVQNLNPSQEIEIKPNTCTALVRKEDLIQEKYLIQQEQQEQQQLPKVDEINCGSSTSYQPTEHEKFLFDKVWNNQMRIDTQHQQLMIKAAKVLSVVSNNNDSFIKKNTNYQIEY